MFYHLESGLNELLTYMVEEYSNSPDKIEVEVEPELYPEAMEFIDAHLFNKPQIIIALNKVVGKLSEDDVALMKEFDVLYEYGLAFINGSEQTVQKIQGLIEDIQPGSQADDSDKAHRERKVRSLADEDLEKPISLYDLMVLKAENLLFQLNRLLERYE